MVGLVPPQLGEGHINQHIALARPLAGLSPEYLAWSLTTDVCLGHFRESQRGIKNSLGLDDVRRLRIPVPPLAEQDRIVTKVNELMALCDQLEEKQRQERFSRTRVNTALLDQLVAARNPDEFQERWQRVVDNFEVLYDNVENIARLRRAIFDLAVRGHVGPQSTHDESVEVLLDRVRSERGSSETPKGKRRSTEATEQGALHSIPTSWRWTSLGGLCVFGPQNGYSPRSVEKPTSTKSLTLTATTSGRFDGSFFKYIDEVIPSDSDLWLQDGDILIQRGNSLEYVGIAAVYRGEPNQFIYPDLMMKVRLVPSMLAEYVHLCLVSTSSRAYFMSNASGTSGSMPKVNQSVVMGAPIPIPPLAEQHRIVSKVAELMKLCDELESAVESTSRSAEVLAGAISRIASWERREAPAQGPGEQPEKTPMVLQRSKQPTSLTGAADRGATGSHE